MKLPSGTKIHFKTGWIWEVKSKDVIRYPETGQESSLLFFSRKDYKVLV